MSDGRQPIHARLHDPVPSIGVFKELRDQDCEVHLVLGGA